jgi:hypothetical protein
MHNIYNGMQDTNSYLHVVVSSPYRQVKSPWIGFPSIQDRRKTNGNYFPFRYFSTIIIRGKRWITYLFTMVVFAAPAFDLVDQAPKHKKGPKRNKRNLLLLHYTIR